MANYSELMDNICDIIDDWIGESLSKSNLSTKDAFFLIKEVVKKEDG